MVRHAVRNVPGAAVACEVVPVIGDCGVPACLAAFASLVGMSAGHVQTVARKVTGDKLLELTGEVGELSGEWEAAGAQASHGRT